MGPDRSMLYNFFYSTDHRKFVINWNPAQSIFSPYLVTFIIKKTHSIFFNGCLYLNLKQHLIRSVSMIHQSPYKVYVCFRYMNKQIAVTD